MSEDTAQGQESESQDARVFISLFLDTDSQQIWACADAAIVSLWGYDQGGGAQAVCSKSTWGAGIMNGMDRTSQNNIQILPIL